MQLYSKQEQNKATVLQDIEKMLICWGSDLPKKHVTIVSYDLSKKLSKVIDR